MSKNVIIFGAKRFGVSNTPVVEGKYPNRAVVTIEAAKSGGRSRRVLFNAKASELLNLSMGDVQQIVFGFVEGTTTGLVANASLLGAEIVESMTTYRTSKNKVNFDNSKEKGKAISSSSIANEIAAYFDLDNNIENELFLSSYDSDEVESFSMNLTFENDDFNAELDNTLAEAADVSDIDVDFSEVSAEVSENNTEETTEELVSSVEPVESNDGNDFSIQRGSSWS